MNRAAWETFARVVSAILCLAIAPTTMGQEAEPADKDGWISLFDGKSLGKWKKTKFGGEGTVEVEDGVIHLDVGQDLTGITWQGEVPHDDYEIELQAKRVNGNDFFCGLTFPVGKDSCSFIVGGWGGRVVGLSSIDGFDASENETSHHRTFETDRWYRIRLRVAGGKIQTWIDDEPICDVTIGDRRISIRFEVEPSKPLGIATWRTGGALRGIRLRKLEAKSSTPAPKSE